MAEDAPRISVVVAAFDASATLGACLDALLAQELPGERPEILVVDDGSSDGSEQIARVRPSVRLLRQERLGPSIARNRGIEAARGDLVAFTDADCVAAPDWLARLAAHFEDPRVLAVGGSQACPADATPIQRDIHAVLSWMGFLGGYTKSARLVVETPHNPSCNVMYRRETLLAAGGFRAGMYPGEDVDLDFRLRTWHMDARILYDPDARVAHYRPRTLKGWFRMMQRYGDSSGVNVRLHGFFRLLHAAPLVFGGAGAAWMAWTLSRPFQGLTGALGALLLVTAFVAWRSRDLPMPRLGRRLVMLLAIPFTFSFGFLRGLLREPPRARRAP